MKELSNKIKEFEEFLSEGEYSNTNGVFWDSIDYILEEMLSLNIRDRKKIKNIISKTQEPIFDKIKKEKTSTTA